MPWMLVMLYLVLSRCWYRTFIQTYSATSPLNPHWEMDKSFSPSYSSSQITYVESEGFSRFRRKRTVSASLTQSPPYWKLYGDGSVSSHFSKSRDPSYVRSDMFLKRLRKEWRTKPFRLQSETTGKWPKEAGGVTTSPTLLGTILAWSQQN